MLKDRHSQEVVGNKHAKDLSTIAVFKDKGDHAAKITVLVELKPHNTVSQLHRDEFCINCRDQEVVSHNELPALFIFACWVRYGQVNPSRFLTL